MHATVYHDKTVSDQYKCPSLEQNRYTKIQKTFL